MKLETLVRALDIAPEITHVTLKPEAWEGLYQALKDIPPTYWPTTQKDDPPGSFLVHGRVIVRGKG